MNRRSDMAKHKISKLQGSNRSYPKMQLREERELKPKTSKKLDINKLWENSSSFNKSVPEAIVARHFSNCIKTINPEIKETQ